MKSSVTGSMMEHVKITTDAATRNAIDDLSRGLRDIFAQAPEWSGALREDISTGVSSVVGPVVHDAVKEALGGQFTGHARETQVASLTTSVDDGFVLVERRLDALSRQFVGLVEVSGAAQDDAVIPLESARGAQAPTLRQAVDTGFHAHLEALRAMRSQFQGLVAQLDARLASIHEDVSARAEAKEIASLREACALGFEAQQDCLRDEASRIHDDFVAQSEGLGRAKAEIQAALAQLFEKQGELLRDATEGRNTLMAMLGAVATKKDLTGLQGKVEVGVSNLNSLRNEVAASETKATTALAEAEMFRAGVSSSLQRVEEGMVAQGACLKEALRVVKFQASQISRQEIVLGRLAIPWYRRLFGARK